MAEYFAGGRLRFVNGELRNDDGDIGAKMEKR